MNHIFPKRISAVFGAISEWLIRLVREMAPAVLFFFIAFLLIFFLFKLFVSQYAIEFSALSKAAVTALIVAKVIFLVDWAESGHQFNHYRRAVLIGGQTVLYCLVVMILGVGERFVHDIRKAGDLQDGLTQFIANANVDRFLGGALLVSLVVGSYLVMQEISHAMGKGALYKHFFERPVTSDR